MEYLEHLDKLAVCFIEYHHDDANQTDCWGIYGQMFSSGGEYLWDENGHEIIPLNCTMDTTYNEIHIDESINDNILLTYNKDYFSIVGSDTSLVTHVFGLSLDADGELVWSPSVVPISLTGSNKYQSAISNLAENQWIVAWNDNISDPDEYYDFGIYAQNISVDGKLGPLSIDEKPYKNINNVVISPNPSLNTFEINYDLNEKGSVKIELLDLDGRIVKHLFEGNNASGTNSKQFNIENISAGMYIIILQVNESVFQQKMVIN
jgi:type IX secretion system substrate protein